jgi:hypothetical protein
MRPDLRSDQSTCRRLRCLNQNQSKPSFIEKHLLKLRLAGVAVILFLGMAAAAQTISIQFEGGAFKVAGWRAPAAAPAQGWSSVFVVYAGAGDVPALLGSYAVEGGVLVFHPSYPIAPGVRYRAVFHLPGGGAPLEKTFDGPHRDTIPLARVEHVYPSTDVLPSNQLRLYIYFSAPMSRGEAAQHIHMLDENGKDLQGTHGVFLPGEELWDPNFQRLTMTFDPGRIKRGLTSNETIGPPIAEGKRYTLVIDRQWPDARGVPMVEGFRKVFRGGPALRTPPDPGQWRITAPQAGTSGALLVDFPTPMNYPLLQRMLQVSGGSGAVAGTVAVALHETEWRFTPRQPWKAGDYQLVVDTAIEDLAGNHVGQPFDVDVFAKVTEHITTKTVSLPFTIR